VAVQQDELERRLRRRLVFLYGEDRAEGLLAALRILVARHRGQRRGGRQGPRWSELDSLLISYGDSVQFPGRRPLAALKEFLDRRLLGVFSMVHLLPFFPYSSDDGFAVTDFRAVNPDLGDWGDIASLGEHFDLVFDLVLNHMSREHLWFVQYMYNERPGRGFVIEVDPAENLSMVVRPRSTPLLSRARTPRGIRHVWATFSNDQIDLNYANPEMLLEMVDILLSYIRHGARGLRLDAVGYLWKRIGTPCIHLPETHEVVKLFRDLLDYLEPGATLLTETNVPHAENISYFGAGDEAHMVYQFSLPPLVLHAIHTGVTRYLTAWARGLESMATPPGCTYLNFTASHDGVGLRPLEGLVPEAEVERLLDAMRARGGYVSMRATREGCDRPYELNISYFDAFRDPVDALDPWQVPRFLLSQTLPLALQGIPGVYINALTATPNDPLGVERTGMTRSINRRKWDGLELEHLLDDPDALSGQVFAEYVRRLRLRQGLPAFHPEAPQRILELGEGTFALERVSLDAGQRLLALHNCTQEPRKAVCAELAEGSWVDVLDPAAPELGGGSLTMKPYQAVWLVQTSA
jgi:sucrose phosphorylase